MDLLHVAQALRGEVSGRQVLFPAPGHSRADRSVSLRFDPRAPDGFLVHSFAGDHPMQVKDYVRSRLGKAAVRKPPNFARSDGLRSEANGSMARRALTIWREGQPPRGTPVETYLRHRGLDLPDSTEEAIRYHPSCPFADARVPALVALVRNIASNAPQAIHRTALLPDGRKGSVKGKDRLALGPIAGGAIKLTADEDVTTCLGVGEGLESALSLRLAQEFGCSPIWALMSAGGVAGFPVIPAIESLWIAVDHDRAGIAAADALASQWHAAGREIFRLRPVRQRSDLNDLVRERG